MENWRRVWRDGVAPLLSDDAMEALRRGLLDDDQRLVQGTSMVPPPLPSVQDWPVEAACALGYCGWQGEGLQIVAEVDEFFARTCFEVDHRLAQPGGCRWFLNWFDNTPREAMRQELLAEVCLAQSQRVELEPLYLEIGGEG